MNIEELPGYYVYFIGCINTRVDHAFLTDCWSGKVRWEADRYDYPASQRFLFPSLRPLPRASSSGIPHLP